MVHRSVVKSVVIWLHILIVSLFLLILISTNLMH